MEKDLWSCFGLKGQGDWKRLKVTIRALPGLRGSTDDDQALQIEGRTQRGQKEAFKVFLLSVDRQEKLELNDNFKATRLPVMLASGPDELIRIFRRSLEKHFDCVTGIEVFTQAELKWMSALWIDLKPKKEESKKTPIMRRKSKRNENKSDLEDKSEGKDLENEPDEEEEEDDLGVAKNNLDHKVRFSFTLPEESSKSGIRKFELKLRQNHLVDLWKRYVIILQLKFLIFKSFNIEIDHYL